MCHESLSNVIMPNYFRRVKEYEKAYLDGKKAGKELEQVVKIYKSHRRVLYEQ